MERHETLTLVCAGSIPATPTVDIGQKGVHRVSVGRVNKFVTDCPVGRIFPHVSGDGSSPSDNRGCGTYSSRVCGDDSISKGNFKFLPHVRGDNSISARVREPSPRSPPRAWG